MSESVARLVPTQPDGDLAADFKRRLIEVHEPVLKLLTEIDASGFEAHVSCSKGPLGNFTINSLKIVKVY